MKILIDNSNESDFTTTLDQFIADNQDEFVDNLSIDDISAMQSLAIGQSYRIIGFVGSVCDVTRLS